VNLQEGDIMSVLESSGVQKGRADIPASRAVRVRLTSMQVSIDELRPQAMQAYGQMEGDEETCLSGIVSELRVLTKQVEQFLAG